MTEVLAVLVAICAHFAGAWPTVARAMELAMDAPGREAAHREIAASSSGFMPRVDFEQSYTGGNNPVYVFGTLLTQHRSRSASRPLRGLAGH